MIYESFIPQREHRPAVPAVSDTPPATGQFWHLSPAGWLYSDSPRCSARPAGKSPLGGEIVIAVSRLRFVLHLVGVDLHFFQRVPLCQIILCNILRVHVTAVDEKAQQIPQFP